MAQCFASFSLLSLHARSFPRRRKCLAVTGTVDDWPWPLVVSRTRALTQGALATPPTSKRIHSAQTVSPPFSPISWPLQLLCGFLPARLQQQKPLHHQGRLLLQTALQRVQVLPCAGPKSKDPRKAKGGVLLRSSFQVISKKVLSLGLQTSCRKSWCKQLKSIFREPKDESASGEVGKAPHSHSAKPVPSLSCRRTGKTGLS